MADGPGRRKAERAGVQAFRDDAAHLCKIVRGGVLVVPGMSSTRTVFMVQTSTNNGL